MALRLKDYIEKATGSAWINDDLSTGNGLLSPAQARQFLRDAIETTEILDRADTFDSPSPKFEVPKLAMGSRVLRRGVKAQRIASANWVQPDTSGVTLSTELFRGEVPVGDDLFEDNLEREGIADTIMAMLAMAVGRDLEEIAIKSNEVSTDTDFTLLPDGGLVQQFIDAADNIYDATTVKSYKAMFKAMVAKLPVRFRSTWSSLVIYVTPAVADGYADELGDRATGLGDANVDSKPVQRYRGIPVVEVPLLSGTDTHTGPVTVDFATYAMLTNPKNIKVGFSRRVRIERFRDPREEATSFLPSVRFDIKVAQTEAAVLAENVPAL